MQGWGCKSVRQQHRSASSAASKASLRDFGGSRSVKNSPYQSLQLRRFVCDFPWQCPAMIAQELSSLPTQEARRMGLPLTGSTCMKHSCRSLLGTV